MAGEVEMTLTLYPFPAMVLSGTLATIEPEEVDDTLPMTTGLPKQPNSSESWAMKLLPPLKVPVAV